MKKLKSFIYLDEYKMYSLSSQMFEGLTDFIVNTTRETLSTEESQKGQIASGRIMANIIASQNDKQTKKFLHDYSYTVFEESLIKDNRVLEISKESLSERSDEIDNYSFIKLKGKAIFNDSLIIAESLKKFNDFGNAIGYFQYRELADQQAEINNSINQIKNRNQKAQAKKKFSKDLFKNFLVEQGLNMEDELLSKLIYVVEYGYKGMFEIQFPFPADSESVIFNSTINRKYLKEDEHSIVTKYSRETDKDLVLFGMITQSKTISLEKPLEEIITYLEMEAENMSNGETTIALSIKSAIMRVVNAFIGVENGFIGKSGYEYIVDPISIYKEI